MWAAEGWEDQKKKKKSGLWGLERTLNRFGLFSLFHSQRFMFYSAPFYSGALTESKMWGNKGMLMGLGVKFSCGDRNPEQEQTLSVYQSNQVKTTTKRNKSVANLPCAGVMLNHLQASINQQRSRSWTDAVLVYFKNKLWILIRLNKWLSTGGATTQIYSTVSIFIPQK